MPEQAARIPADRARTAPIQGRLERGGKGKSASEIRDMADLLDDEIQASAPGHDVSACILATNS
jgi:hypothetical protein